MALYTVKASVFKTVEVLYYVEADSPEEALKKAWEHDVEDELEKDEMVHNHEILEDTLEEV